MSHLQQENMTPQTSEPMRTCKVLIVEDNDAQLRTLCDVLSDEGFDTQGCASAADAVAQIEHAEFDVAIVDFRLPDADGIELLNRIRTISRTTRVILHTAHASLTSAKDAVNLGAFAYVEKMSGPEELIRYVYRAAEERMAQALRESEERYRNIYEQGQLGVVVVDSDYRILNANPKFCELLGYSEEELIALQFTDITHPEDVDGDVELAKQVFQGEIPSYQIEKRYLRKDGKTITVNLTASVLRGEQGEPLYRLAMVEDITERKKAEQELRLQGQIVENMAEGIALVRPSDGVIIYSNRPHDRMFGYEPGELLGQDISVCNAPDQHDPEETSRKISEHLERTGSWVGEVHNIKKDGTRFWSHANVTTLEHPEHGTVWVGVLEDITERKRTEDALQESEERFRATFESAAISMTLNDVNGRFIETNPAFKKLFGYSGKELAELKFTQITHPQDREKGWDHFRQLVEGKISNVQLEKRYLRKDGSVILANTTASAIFDSQGQLLYTVGMIQDITARRQAEDALRASESRFRGLLEAELDGVIVVNEQGTINLVNAQAVKMFGYRREELQGKSIELLVPQHLREKHVGHRAAFLNQPRARPMGTELEVIGRRKDGSEFPADVSLSPLETDEGLFVMSIIRDITERKQAETALRDSEQRFRVVFEAAPSGMVIADADGKALRYNSAMLNMLGYSEEEMRSMDISQYTHADDVAEGRRLFAELREGKRDHYQLEKRYIRKDGQVLWGSLAFSSVRNDQGEIQYLIASIKDITERKLAENLAAEQVDRLQKLSQLSLALSGDPLDVFERIVRMLGELLDVSVVCISEIRGDKLNFLCLYAHGEVFTDAGQCPLSITPCATVQETKDICSYSDVASRFPKATFLKEHNAQSYIGLPSLDSNGDVIAVTCLLDEKPRQYTEIDKDLLRIFAQRIGAEMERQKHMVERKRVEADRLRLAGAVESAGEAIFITNTDGIIQYVNPAFTEISGYPQSEAVGNNPRFLKSGKHSAAFYKQMWDTLSRAETWRGQLINRKKDGTLYDVDATIAPVKDSHGQIVNYVAVTRDITERKRVEKALKESEMLLEMAQEIAQIGHWKLNPATGVITGSDELFRIFGLSSDEATLDSFVQVVHPEDRERDVAAIQRGIDHGESWDIEHRLICRDGQEKWVQAIGEAITNETGDVFELVGTVQDITERKQAEEALRESEFKHRSLVESANAVPCKLDLATGRFTYIGQQIEQLLGYPMESWVDIDTWSDRIHPEDREQARAYCMSATSRGEDHEFEYRAIAADGRHVWIRDVVSVIMGEQGPKEIISFMFDITKRKQAEIALQDSEQRFRVVFEAAPSGMVIADADGKALRYNSAMQRMLGYSDEELRSMDISQYTHADDVAEGRRLFEELHQGKCDRYQVEKRYIRKDGQILWGSLAFSSVRDDLGEIQYLIASIKDITERKHAEEQARQLQADLAHMSRLSSMGEMAAGLAHELNQPLTVITNYANGCIRRLNSESVTHDELKEMLERISAQARRGGSIIRGLESLVRKGGVKRAPMDINKSILEVVDLAEVDAKRYKATTHMELQPDLPSVLADPTQVQQVILNLVQNACEACGQVPVSQRVVTIHTALAGDDELEITVSDSGPGVASELGDRLFEPFFTTKVKGIGMGLAISRSIVEAHNGKLWTTANPQSGASFHFTLPIAKEDESHGE